MNTLPVDLSKKKRSQRRPWGCLMLFAIPLLLCAACHGAMWMLARYGGEWVAQQDMPLPPGSQEVYTSEYREDYGFTCRLGVYLYEGDKEEVRDWFVDHGVNVSPNIFKNTTVIDDEAYESNFLDTYDWPLLHYVYVMSVYRFTDHFEDQSPPHRLRIYNSREAFLKYYPTIDMPDGMSGFEVGLCRDDVSRYGFN